MDPILLLTEDHKKVKGLFREFEQASGAQEKQRIAQTVFQELTVHSALEKEIFYPAVSQKGSTEDKELVEHSYHDHAAVEQLISELKTLNATDQQFNSKFVELIANVEEHAEEEETEMFPDARRALGGDLDRLGTEMERRKQALMSQA